MERITKQLTTVFLRFSTPSIAIAIRCKTKTNRHLVTRILPYLAPVTHICFELSLVHCLVYVCCDWPL